MTRHDEPLERLLAHARQENPPRVDVSARVLETIRQSAPVPITPLVWWTAAAAAAAVLVFSLLATQPEDDPQLDLFDDTEIVSL